MRSLAILIMACSLVSCATNDPGNAEQMTSPDKTADAKCPVISSDGWRAWINIMPSPDKERNLHIIGMLELPTPGYDVRLIAGGGRSCDAAKPAVSARSDTAGRDRDAGGELDQSGLSGTCNLFGLPLYPDPLWRKKYRDDKEGEQGFLMALWLV
ncbi:hypothetical protein D6851_07285 [Altericroceibacterium spongiae]|uniref:Lipoprotein n=1 Tax=Altericroceibacterium spongiae TaxID=2320269 RepID=A0A420EMB1_9SPHN|nr:hypothetical protein [Altericroceibacterium spongiae]RKF21813.1 hypothetical protein D6851_07285 [Altericroceibacterium spongiae]